MVEHSVVSAARLEDASWALLSDAVRRLEESWETTSNVELARFVPSGDNPLREHTLVELIKVDQEYRWKLGNRKKLEEYLSDWPELRDKPDIVKELLDAECLTRGILDAVIPTSKELRSRFPEIGDQIDLDSIEAEVQTDHWDSDASVPASNTSKESQGYALPDSDRPLPLPPVGRFGRYEIRGLLGHGGMGTVYRAYDTQLKREVALKIPWFDSTTESVVLERFIREARAAAAIRHQNICPIYDEGKIDGRYYIAMALIEGPSLADWMEGRTIHPRKAAVLVQKVALALDAVHAADIVHRDIKPSNIMIDPSGEPVLMDFGLSRQTTSDSHLTHSCSFLGTFAYMSPEQAKGDGHTADQRTDIYSLGVILFQLVTGELPFRGSVQMLLRQVVEDTPPSPRRLDSHIPRDLETICLKCLEKEPRRRYSSAGELADELDRFLKDEPIYARPAGKAGRFWRWCKRQPVVAALTAAVVVALLVGTGVSTYFAIESHKQAMVALYNEKESKEAKLWTDKALDDVKEALRLAEEERKRADTNLYINHIALAKQEWSAGHVASAEEILDACRPEMRHWEWGYLKRACHSELLTLRGGIGDVAFSPDGEHIASGSIGKTVQVWNATTGKETLTLSGHTEFVFIVAFSPDGRWIASGSGDKTVKIWDSLTGREVLTFCGHSSTVHDMRFTSDGQQITSRDDDTVKVWDTTTGQEKLTLCVVDGHVAFSPCDTRIAVKTSDTTVKVWDTVMGQVVFVLDRSSGPVVFSHDGKRIATTSRDDVNQVRIWDAKTGEEVLTLAEAGCCIAFSHNSKWIVTKNNDGTMVAWDAATGKKIHAIRDVASAISFNTDGTRIAFWSFDNSMMKIWDATTGEQPFVIRSDCFPNGKPAFSPDGKRIALSGYSPVAVRVWDATKRQDAIAFRGHTNDVASVAFSPDGKRIASGSWDKTIKLWDTTTGQELLTLSGHTWFVTDVEFSPDGKWIASGSDDETVKIWNAATGQELFTISGHAGFVSDVEFSPDGKWIACGGVSESVKIWDTATGQELLTLSGHTGFVTDVEFSPDGKWIASGSVDKTVKIWDTATGQELLTISGHTWSVSDVEFSPDGKWIACGGRSEPVKIWDTTTGQEVLTLPRACGNVVFNPNGKQLATKDKLIGKAKIWDLTTGQEMLAIEEYADASRVSDMAFSPDGKRFVSAGGNTLAIRDTNTGQKVLTLNAYSRSTTAVMVNDVVACPCPDTSMAFSPDGKQIALTSGDTFTVWDATILITATP